MTFALKKRSEYIESLSLQTAEPTTEPTEEPTPTPVITPHPIFSKSETDGGLGPEIFEKSEFPGQVVTLEYTTDDYDGYFVDIVKSMRVYLPYGYDASKKYNVLILLHGSDGSDKYWFDEPRWYNDPDYLNSYECYTNNVLDNMIANGLCEPLIVISPTYYLTNSWRMEGDLTLRDSYQFKKELREDILPALAAHYSVYDVGDRDHYAFIGASHGAEICYNGILSDDLDLISWFGVVSGCEGNIYYLEESWQKNGFENLDIKFFYVSAGEFDFMKEDSYNGYLEMKKYSSKVSEQNTDYISIRSSTHEDIVWIDAIYNCLQIFFTY